MDIQPRVTLLAFVGQETQAVVTDEVTLGLIALVGTCLTLLGFAIRNGMYAKTAAKESRQANAAVNHVEFGERRLYEIITNIEAKQAEFDRKWGNLPAEMGDAVGLAELIHRISSEVDATRQMLATHVEECRRMGHQGHSSE